MTAQLSILRGEGPQVRIAGHTGSLMRRIVGGVLFLIVLALLCACSEVVNLQSGLTDSDANEIISLLQHNGVEVRKLQAKEGVTLTVDAKDISTATQIMHGAGLPRRNLSDLGQMFKKDGMISSPLEERVRYIHGLSEELENTMLQFDNVVAARVHVVLPERIAPGEPIQPSSAAVFVKYRAPFDEDSAIPRIRNLVASSIPGLGGEDGKSKVSVVLTPSDATQVDTDWQAVGPFIVRGGSAGPLTVALTGLIAFSAILVIALILAIVAGRESLLNRLGKFKNRFGKIRGKQERGPNLAASQDAVS